LDSALATINRLSQSLATLEERDAEQTRLLSSVEERLGEGCTCGGSEGRDNSGPPSERNNMDGWVGQLDRDAVREMRQSFNRRPSADKNAGEEDTEDDSDNEVEINPGVLDAIGKTFADMMAPRVIEKAGRSGVSIVRSQGVNKTEPSAPEESRPSRFPFHTDGKQLTVRNKREITENDVYTQIEDTFTDLVKSNKKCAFSAIRTVPLLGIENTPQAITFQKNMANKGKSFERGKGVFTCKIPGIYYFSYTMRSYDERHIGVALMLNESPVVAVTTDASKRKVMQTQSSQLQLVEGDQVWLLLGPNENFGIYGNDFNYNTFNGYLLYPNYI